MKELTLLGLLTATDMKASVEEEHVRIIRLGLETCHIIMSFSLRITWSLSRIQPAAFLPLSPLQLSYKGNGI